MARARSFTAGALLLVTGAGLGVALDHLIIFHLHGAMHSPMPLGAAHHAKLLAELDTVLQLTPQQHDTISAILTRHQQAIDSAWIMIHVRLTAGMDSVHHELRMALNPEQLQKLGLWMQRISDGH